MQSANDASQSNRELETDEKNLLDGPVDEFDVDGNGNSDEGEPEVYGDEEKNEKSKKNEKNEENDGFYDCRAFGIRQALPVPDGEPDWDSGPPQTAEEYLKRVRWEADRCEQTVRADINPRQFDEKRTQYVPNTVTPQDCSEDRLPTVHWMKNFIKDFRKLRQTMEKWDEEDDEPLPMGVPIMVNPSLSVGNCREADLACIKQNEKPMLGEIANLDQVETSRLLKVHISDFIKESKKTVDEIRVLWLYALLARIHKPLHADLLTLLRSLLLHCAKLRAKMNELDKKVLLPRLNILIVLAGVYFGQGEKMAGMIDMDMG